MSSPGIMMAMRIFPTEISAIAPQSTARALGGIIMAKPPLPKIGPRLIGFLYPCFSISGISEDPSIATLARLVPVRVEKRVPTATASRLNLPGIRPIHLSRVSIMTGAMPEWNMSSPIRMKSGTGSNMKEFKEL